MADPILYGPDYSTYVRTSRLALEEKGVAYRLESFDFLRDGMPAAQVRRHPFAKVPAFEHDGFALYETQAILRYIDEGFPVAPLQPTDLHEFARMNQIIGIVDAYAYPAIISGIVINRLVAPRLGWPVDEAAVAAAVPRARLCLSEFARLMGEQPYLAGDRVSLADLMLVPILTYFSRTEEGEEPIAAHPRLRPWLRRMQERQSFQVTRPVGL